MEEKGPVEERVVDVPAASIKLPGVKGVHALVVVLSTRAQVPEARDDGEEDDPDPQESLPGEAGR